MIVGDAHGCSFESGRMFQRPADMEQWPYRPVPTPPVRSTKTFIPSLNRPQVAEGRCGYSGSNKAVSVERDSLRKEQLLEPLPLFE